MVITAKIKKGDIVEVHVPNTHPQAGWNGLKIKVVSATPTKVSGEVLVVCSGNPIGGSGHSVGSSVDWNRPDLLRICSSDDDDDDATSNKYYSPFSGKWV